MMRRSLYVLAFLALGCSSNTPSSQPGDGGAESSVNGTVCGDSSFFTACVRACGEADTSESTAAHCVDGMYQCDAPLIPAAACDANTWTVPRLPCGPWVAGYDCGQTCAICDAVRGWSCGACPDASTAGSP